MTAINYPALTIRFSNSNTGITGAVYILDDYNQNGAIKFMEMLGLQVNPLNLGSGLSRQINWYRRYIEIPIPDAAKGAVIPEIQFAFKYTEGAMEYDPGCTDSERKAKDEYLKLLGYDSPEDLCDKLITAYGRRGVVATRMGKEWSGTAEDLNDRYTESMYFELPEFWKELSARYNYTFDFDNYPKSVFQLGQRIGLAAERKSSLPSNFSDLTEIQVGVLIITFFIIGVLVGRAGI